MTGRPELVILGDGYLAGFVLHEKRAEHVVAVRRQPARDSDPRVQRIACDVLSAAGIELLRRTLVDFAGDVVFMLPPSAFGTTPPAVALAPLLGWAADAGVRRVVLVSSTGVYADNAAGCVSANSPTPAHSERVRRLLAIEAAFADAGLPLGVLRLAGLYGPGRLIGRQALCQARPLPGAPDAWLNLLHAADAARAIVALLDAPTITAPLLLSDGKPVERGHYYATAAALLGAPPPVFDGTTPRRGGSRRVDPTASWAALGLTPEYADFAAAIEAILLQEEAAGKDSPA